MKAPSFTRSSILLQEWNLHDEGACSGFLPFTHTSCTLTPAGIDIAAANNPVRAAFSSSLDGPLLGRGEWCSYRRDELRHETGVLHMFLHLESDTARRLLEALAMGGLYPKRRHEQSPL
jgi:hypothetical protein